MKTRVLIAIILLSLMLAGPASAVKRVPKSSNQATEQPQREPQDNQASDKATPPPERPQDTNRGEAQPQQPSNEGHRDNFIDRDGDGINDNIKKPPETVKRKGNEKSERPRESQRPQNSGSDRNQKSEKDRRSR